LVELAVKSLTKACSVSGKKAWAGGGDAAFTEGAVAPSVGTVSVLLSAVGALGVACCSAKLEKLLVFTDTQMPFQHL
jgi:hypothetical protein